MSRRAAGLACIVAVSAATTVAIAAEKRDAGTGPAESGDGGTRSAESGDGGTRSAEPAGEGTRQLEPAAARRLALRPFMPAGAREVRDRSRALRVTLPPGWHRSRANVVPRVA